MADRDGTSQCCGTIEICISFFLFLQNNQASEIITAFHSYYTLSLIDLDSPESIKTEYVIQPSHGKCL
jgi:hypothetical protein